MLTAKDIMTSEVLTLPPQATLREAIEALTEHGISGAPITTAKGKVLGIISELGLLDVLFEPEIVNDPVSEYMTRAVQTVGEDEPIAAVAQIFALYGIRRVPVLRDEKLVGIVTRRDLLACSLQCNETSGAILGELELFAHAFDAQQ